MIPFPRIHDATAAAHVLLALMATAVPAGAQDGAVALEVVREPSHVVVLAYRAGALGFLAHDHAILAPDWDATICMVPGQPASATGHVVVRTGTLDIDSERAREAAGLETEGPDRDTRAELRAKMLGERFLDAENHPLITLAIDRVDSVGHDAGVLEATVRGRVAMHGVEREVAFPAYVRSGPGGISVAATLPLAQTGFGIEPESIVGVVRVRDRVQVRIQLVARVTTQPCPRP